MDFDRRKNAVQQELVLVLVLPQRATGKAWTSSTEDDSKKDSSSTEKLLVRNEREIIVYKVMVLASLLEEAQSEESINYVL